MGWPSRYHRSFSAVTIGARVGRCVACAEAAPGISRTTHPSTQPSASDLARRKRADGTSACRPSAPVNSVILMMHPSGSQALLTPVAREALPRVIQPARAAVVTGLRFADPPPQFLDRLLYEPLLTLVVGERGLAQESPDELAPQLDPLEELLKMGSWTAKRTEMRQEERVRIPRQNKVRALTPGLQIDVGRGRRGQNIVALAAPYAGGVAHERDAAPAVEVAHVV